MNAITYKEVFPLIKNNKLWLGPSISSGDREFQVPEDYPVDAAGWRIDEQGRKFLRIKGVRWFTNLDHGRRHQSLAADDHGRQPAFQQAQTNQGENGLRPL